MLQFLAARAIPGVEMVRGDRYTRTVEVDGTSGVIAVEPSGEALRVETGLPSSARPEITARLSRLFDLDANPEVIGAHLSRDPLLAPLVAARPGLRVPGAWDGFELAVRAMLGQQITVSAARSLAGTLVARHGKQFVSGGLTHLFPRAEDLGSVTLPMPRQRNAYLTGLAKAVADDPEVLTTTDLRKLPGIGDWTAEYIRMRVLKDPDAFPSSDVALLRAVGRPKAAALLAMAERWRPWRAYAAQHLWTA